MVNRTHLIDHDLLQVHPVVLPPLRADPHHCRLSLHLRLDLVSTKWYDICSLRDVHRSPRSIVQIDTDRGEGGSGVATKGEGQKVEVFDSQFEP